jgi:hypothetical protein
VRSRRIDELNPIEHQNPANRRLERRLVRGVYVISFVFLLTRAERPLHVESAERHPGLAAALCANDLRPGTRQHIVAAAVDGVADTDHVGGITPGGDGRVIQRGQPVTAILG